MTLPFRENLVLVTIHGIDNCRQPDKFTKTGNDSNCLSQKNTTSNGRYCSLMSLYICWPRFWQDDSVENFLSSLNDLETRRTSFKMVFSSRLLETGFNNFEDRTGEMFNSDHNAQNLTLFLGHNLLGQDLTHVVLDEWLNFLVLWNLTIILQIHDIDDFVITRLQCIYNRYSFYNMNREKKNLLSICLGVE